MREHVKGSGSNLRKGNSLANRVGWQTVSGAALSFAVDNNRGGSGAHLDFRRKSPLCTGPDWSLVWELGIFSFSRPAMASGRLFAIPNSVRPQRQAPRQLEGFGDTIRRLAVVYRAIGIQAVYVRKVKQAQTHRISEGYQLRLSLVSHQKARTSAYPSMWIRRVFWRLVIYEPHLGNVCNHRKAA
jgi:hypothetical protein